MKRWRWLGVVVAAVVVVLAGCSGSAAESVERAQPPSADSSTTTSTTTTTTTTEPPPTTEAPELPVFEPLYPDPEASTREQVEEAYLYSWEITLDAGRHGRTEFLHLGFAEPHLELRTGNVQELIDNGHSLAGDVEHNYEITVKGPDEAFVLDFYVNGMHLVDQATGEPIDEPSNEVRRRGHEMRRIDGRWLVTYVVNYS